METHNNTGLSRDELAKLKFIGKTISEWRARNITLYEHPTDPKRLISIGIAFDNCEKVIADESREDWAMALEHISRGQVYVSK